MRKIAYSKPLLDCLSLGKQVRAKAVLNRDLRELQARREALERPVIEEDSSLPANTFDMRNTPSHALMNLEHEPILEHESKDTVMNDSVEIADIGSPEAKVEGSPVSHSLNLVTKNQAEVQSHELLETSMRQAKIEGFAMQDDVQQATENATNKNAIKNLSLDLSVTVPSAAEEAPITSGLQSSTFESMFDNGDSDLFGFEFTTDTNGDQSHDFDGGNGDLDLSSFGDEANNQDNMEPMLQDFGGYGNGSNSDLMLNISNNTDDPNNQNGDQGDNSAADDFGSDLDIVMGMGANESNFSDMVGDIDYSNATDDISQFDSYLTFDE
jgi:hypothetical protein